MDTLWIKDLETMVPNLVTGNGDGKNDLLNIEALSFYPENELVIFNRWGKEVFSASPYQNNWPSADVQPGTYFYRLQAGGKSVTGWVMVGR
jgi:gliding motility-associated-like protein